MVTSTKENDMAATRKMRQIQQRNKIRNDLIARTVTANVTKDDYGYYEVRCYDKRGNYIGGAGSLPKTVALNQARMYIGK
jgi:hypothetical protein